MSKIPAQLLLTDFRNVFRKGMKVKELLDVEGVCGGWDWVRHGWHSVQTSWVFIVSDT